MLKDNNMWERRDTGSTSLPIRLLWPTDLFTSILFCSCSFKRGRGPKVITPATLEPTFLVNKWQYINAEKSPMPDMKGQFRGLRASRKSRKKVILKVFLRWLITLAIIGAIYAVLLAFSAMHVMTKATKKLFNTLITALLIMLGLAIASSLDGMIGELRWWILSQRYRSRSKVC